MLLIAFLGHCKYSAARKAIRSFFMCHKKDTQFHDFMEF